MFGVVCGALAFLFGFAMVWHIWWAALASAVGIAVAVGVLSSRDEAEYRISAEEAASIENQRLRRMATAPRPQAAGGAAHIPGAPLQGSLP